MAADVWSDGPEPSGSRKLMHSGDKEEQEVRKRKKKKNFGVGMVRLLALVVWSAVYGVVVVGCEQQAAGSGGVGAVLGGMVVWLWRHCHRSQCQGAINGGRGQVHLDVELGPDAGSEDMTDKDGTPV